MYEFGEPSQTSDDGVVHWVGTCTFFTCSPDHSCGNFLIGVPAASHKNTLPKKD